MLVPQFPAAQRKAVHYVAEDEPSGATLDTASRIFHPWPNARFDAKHSK